MSALLGEVTVAWSRVEVVEMKEKRICLLVE